MIELQEKITLPELVNQAKADYPLLEKRVENLVVENDEEEGKATDLGKLINQLIKDVEEERKKFVKPLNDTVKRINNEFKKTTEPLKKLKEIIRAKLLKYKQLKKEQEQKRLLEEALLTKEESSKIINTQSRGDYGLSTTRKQWDYEVIDISKIPLEYLTVDDKKIKSAIKAGVREIAGIKIFEKETIVIK